MSAFGSSINLSGPWNAHKECCDFGYSGVWEITQNGDKLTIGGRGIVYFGSARFEPGTPLYEKAKDLARRLAATLQCPSWSGGGKGIMGAVTHGAIHGCVRRQLQKTS
ncbi:hypothetical protein PPROV_000255700 [Pycnococcus provasolii]|uniref:Uncharacterized protein n=1 Tax=Pycnococcus provasolii TaxID=41880 RepID=A0A830HAX5_9CHLO|nr:hypothetical protein PPROV_000255700 [Pycnococcus provasolii]